jgi:hypothetical protein
MLVDSVLWMRIFIYPKLGFFVGFLYLSLISPGGSYIEMGRGEKGEG